jgi:hypothetical protein
VPQAVRDLFAHELIEIEHALTQDVGGDAREAALMQKSDWQEIDAAFRASRDPLGGADVQREFLKLKQRITNLLPRKLRRHPRG